MTRVQVLYWIDPTSPKADAWNDGFVAAVEALPELGYEVIWSNIHGHAVDDVRAVIDAASPDFVIAKSNWRWHVDRVLRELGRRPPVPTGLMISGAVKPIRKRQQRFYATLWYQTEWYAQTFLGRHPREFHGYGANTIQLAPPTHDVTRDIDVLYVGAVTEPKRLDRFAARDGRRVVVTDLAAANAEILEMLRRADVELVDFVPMAELPAWYWRARCVYVPATTPGGGERPIMEAIACGAPVEVEDDNPKLLEVARDSHAWTVEYYARQLSLGIEAGLRA